MSDQLDPLPIDPANVEIKIKPNQRGLVPWFKNERVFGNQGPQSATALRVLIIAFVAALAIMAWGTITAFSAASRSNAQIATYHAARLQDEAQVHDELNQLQTALGNAKAANRDLACSVLRYFTQQLPEHRPSQAFMDFLNQRYSCASFHPSPSVPSTAGK